MSLSRSPSPRPGGGWASPGLNSPGFASYSGRSSPGKPYTPNGANSVTWESAKAKSEGVNGYPSFSTQNNGFFNRHYRKISSSLPHFNLGGERPYAEKEKLGRGRNGKLAWFMGRIGRSSFLKKRIIVLITFLIVTLIFYSTRQFPSTVDWSFADQGLAMHYWWRRTPWLGGGKKHVIILAANQGGGVMEWKGPREWAIERDSVRNKRKYANRWGYDLEIVDMSTKKRYAHEWRESWEKVDTIRNCLRKYPEAEWFWWLDLNTFIMEPSYSLQSHIFNNLAGNTYRDINDYNPLNITHPFEQKYLDPVSQSPEGDGKADSINLVVPQDCSGFNLGSFFIRRSAWTDRLLDVWWDPVGYEQKHMEWEHKEQDALEFLYTNQPWIRPHTAFIPQRKINSFPPGACSDNGNNSLIHYDEKERDFLVNMAGCEWGRDCWGEMYNYRELSNYLNRTWWERFKEDLVAVVWEKITGQKIKL
ncbi:golgi mannosyltransferase complex subunit [Phlyctema vagabunda]|uniref:Golgi mannosyltransferase complex subunit n=1 Tax=Phlyctema vagabunda TaxID=108571 RepID=A0ABR4P5Q1_9HELO